MGLDEVTRNNLLKTQALVKKNKKVELSLEEIHEIVDSQFISANFAFKRKIDVRLPVFGTFKYNYKDALNVGMSKLKELKDNLSKEEYVKHHRQLRKDFLEAKKERKLKRIPTLADLKKYNTIIKTKNRYNKVINSDLDGTEGN